MGKTTISEISVETESTPEFARTEGVRRMFGLKRGTLYNLFNQGKIKGVVLRQRGNVQGVRLWDVQSIRDYIRSQMNDKAA